jgi:hypothetical protein
MNTNNTKTKFIATNRADSGPNNREKEPIAYYYAMGDCHFVHIGDFRNSIIEQYGEDSVSEIQIEDDHAFFEYNCDIDIDWYKEMDIPKSMSSVSSDSCKVHKYFSS